MLSLKIIWIRNLQRRCFAGASIFELCKDPQGFTYNIVRYFCPQIAQGGRTPSHALVEFPKVVERFPVHSHMLSAEFPGLELSSLGALDVVRYY